jgi:endonuclease-3
MDRILQILSETYTAAISGLAFTNAFELLIATILSAQCTDKQVNKVTPKLFADYPDAQSMAKLTAGELEPYIKSCGFYATKAKNIVATCNMLVEGYDGRVPADIDEMQKLPGVGRKTANVVASNAFGIPAIAVDTHVFRVSNRLGLANAKNVEKTEEQLMGNIPREDWSDAHHWLIWHGREICGARKPKCESCPLTAYCKYHQKESREAAKKETKR